MRPLGNRREGAINVAIMARSHRKKAPPKCPRDLATDGRAIDWLLEVIFDLHPRDERERAAYRAAYLQVHASMSRGRVGPGPLWPEKPWETLDGRAAYDYVVGSIVLTAKRILSLKQAPEPGVRRARRGAREARRSQKPLRGATLPTEDEMAHLAREALDDLATRADLTELQRATLRVEMGDMPGEVTRSRRQDLVQKLRQAAAKK